MADNVMGGAWPAGRRPPKKDKEDKSVVFSVRLHPDIPVERKALEAIEAWQAQGYTMRYIVAQACALVADAGLPPPALTIQDLLEVERRLQARFAEVTETLASRLAIVQHANSTVEQSMHQPVQQLSFGLKDVLQKTAQSAQQSAFGEAPYLDRDDDF